MSQDSLKEYVRLGHYFTDAKQWYNYKYLAPIAQKAWAFYAIVILFIILASLGLTIRQLLPIKEVITYGISVEDKTTSGAESATIIEMDEEVYDTPPHFISSVLLKNYIINRESYNYDELAKQFRSLKNNSTRVVFKKFYDYMAIDNADSPVLRYQKYAKRSINIHNIQFLTANQAIIRFNSIGKDSTNKIFENLEWEAKVGFDIGNLKTKLPTGSKFEFTVTDYTLKLLGEK